MSNSDKKSPVETAEIKQAALPSLVSDAAAGAPLLRRQYELIRDVKVRLFALLGEAEITVGKLFDMRAGEVLTLERPLNEPVEIQLDGKTVARGEIVVVGDSFGLRITETPER
ncbi:MAG: flagellar motor switch protein FliN [Nevskia sp.]|nr:flagellar motor switch protein FliN [Nevskia sp.]